MTLSAKITYGVVASYSGARGAVSAAGALNEAGSISLVDGTAAGEADGLYSDTPTLTAGQTITYALSAGLVDLYGQTLDFSALKLILIEADLANTADLIVGGGTWPGPFGDASNTIAVKPGCAFVMACQDANGWPVADGADELLITCAAAGDYSLTLIGVSSAISAPAYTVGPAIIGTPQVGVECDCTDGDWSGNPVFAYQWLRGGSKIGGATSAAYTPVSADLGKPLARQTVASNIAGGTLVTTAPVTCGAAPGGVLDFSDPNNSALAGH